MVAFDPCPRCGDDVGAVVTTDPGIETMAPCGCRVAVDGGSVHPEIDERDDVSRDATELFEEPNRNPNTAIGQLTLGSPIPRPHLATSRLTDNIAQRPDNHHPYPGEASQTDFPICGFDLGPRALAPDSVDLLPEARELVWPNRAREANNDHNNLQYRVHGWTLQNPIIGLLEGWWNQLTAICSSVRLFQGIEPIPPADLTSEVDRGDGSRTDGGTDRCEMSGCEREVHDTVYPGDREYRLCRPCKTALLIGHDVGKTGPSSTETEQSEEADRDV